VGLSLTKTNAKMTIHTIWRGELRREGGDLGRPEEDVEGDADEFEADVGEGHDGGEEKGGEEHVQTGGGVSAGGGGGDILRRR
jgi:hypothetical protein